MTGRASSRRGRATVSSGCRTTSTGRSSAARPRSKRCPPRWPRRPLRPSARRAPAGTRAHRRFWMRPGWWRCTPPFVSKVVMRCGGEALTGRVRGGTGQGTPHPRLPRLPQPDPGVLCRAASRSVAHLRFLFSCAPLNPVSLFTLVTICCPPEPRGRQVLGHRDPQLRVEAARQPRCGGRPADARLPGWTVAALPFSLAPFSFIQNTPFQRRMTARPPPTAGRGPAARRPGPRPSSCT